DDLNHEGALPPSYNLVDVPAEERPVTGVKEERATRPQAAVRGVTPEQPAPHATRPAGTATEVPRPGIIDRIFGWFRRTEAPATTAKPAASAAAAKAERGRSDARRERQGERGQERQRDRQKQRGDRQQTQGRSQEQRPAREQRESRDKRNEQRQQQTSEQKQ